MHLSRLFVLGTLLFAACDTAAPEPMQLASLSEAPVEQLQVSSEAAQTEATSGWHPCGNHTTKSACEACPYWCVWTGGRCW